MTDAAWLIDCIEYSKNNIIKFLQITREHFQFYIDIDVKDYLCLWLIQYEEKNISLCITLCLVYIS